MAFPFKTGGDFYNCEAQRMRLHNLGANPTETATGLMYFNTGTSNLGKHAVVHDGTNFKALAFVDEIATNTAFTELANRVLTIEKALGEDTANVIDTWEEIQNFLKDIDDNDANLMTMLNGKADKTQLANYLPLSGGTLTGNLVLSNGYLQLSVNSKIYGFNIDAGNGEPVYLKNSTWYTLIHSGNYNSYAPKLDGTGASGTWGINISGNAATANGLFSGKQIGDANTVSFTDSTLRWYSFIPSTTSNLPITTGYQNGLLALPLHENGVTAQLYFSAEKKPYFRSTQTSDWNEIAYVTDNVASATKLQTARTIWGQSFDGTGNVSGDLSEANNIFASGAIVSGRYTDNQILIESNNDVLGTSVGGISAWLGDFRPLTIDGSLLVLNKRSHGNVLIDTAIDNGAKLHVNGNIDSFSDGNYSGVIGLNRKTAIGGLYNTSYAGWQIANRLGKLEFYCELISGIGHFPMVITEAGNVGIGTNDPQYKLDVAGTGRFTGAVTMGSTLTVGGNITPSTNDAYTIGTSSNQWSHLYAVGATLSGAVTIKGDLVVEGNIIGKKEVSAGGVGQEGESGAGGGAEVISQTLASGASSYTIANTIKRSDIAVSLYEWNASGNSWDMCLADISVTASNITVTFGSATTVNHKLVAVG